ncbi:hypothetical protein F5Y19DRAFT_165918 [Xylariaceae sp. FL1651]|nr:hypothetical protein F5Y19DRAFT_165918 [Xylariaceae sp. FL1651]
MITTPDGGSFDTCTRSRTQPRRPRMGFLSPWALLVSNSLFAFQLWCVRLRRKLNRFNNKWNEFGFSYSVHPLVSSLLSCSILAFLSWSRRDLSGPGNEKAHLCKLPQSYLFPSTKQISAKRHTVCTYASQVGYSGRGRVPAVEAQLDHNGA